MKLRLFLPLLLLTLFGCRGTDAKPRSFKKYEGEWQKIDSLYKREGLPKSALKIVNKVYREAKSRNNTVQIIKALIHKMKFIQEVEEETLVKVQKEMQDELKTMKFPGNAVLSSMIAQQYWNYYLRNRWKIQGRTKTLEFIQDDMRTWDMKTIVEQVLAFHDAALKDKKKLQQIGIGQFREIIKNNSEDSLYRPTLYDFLAHRAVDFFIHSEAGLTRPADQFTLNNKKYLSDYRIFSKVIIETSDTLSFHYRAVNIFQDLIKFHAGKKNVEALIDLELKRLKFIYGKINIDKKDELYEKSLNHLVKTYSKNPASAEVKHSIAELYSSLGNQYKPLISDKYKWHKQKAFKYCEETIEAYKDSRGAAQCRRLIHNLSNKALELSIEGYVPPNLPFPGLVRYKNINKLFFKTVKASKQQMEVYKRSSYRQRDSLVTHLSNGKPVGSWSISVPDDGDYQRHSAEFKIPGHKPGLYAVIASSHGDFNLKKNALFWSFFHATRISFIEKRHPSGKLEMTLLNRESGQPLKNAKARAWFEKWDRKTQKYILKKGKLFSADKLGSVNIKPGFIDRGSFFLEFSAGSESLFFNKSFYVSKNREHKRKNTSTYFFTDRAIYRPGQTVYFKGIMMETNHWVPEQNKVVKNRSTTVKLFDVNHQKVSSLDLKTNRFGTFSGEFQLPQGLLNGSFYINNQNGSHSFSVEEYKRPKFEVTFPQLEKTYRLHDEVTVKGSAKALAGFNIDNAQVKYRVVRNTFYPYWCWWWGYNPPSPQMEIANGVTKTDVKGGFVITFKALPDPSVSKEDRPAFNYIIYADVTDINGETRGSNKTVTLGYTSLKLDIKIPPVMDRDSEVSAEINSTNLSGEFMASEGTINIFRLKSPKRIIKKRPWDRPDLYTMEKKRFIEAFPHGLYKDEANVSTWKRSKNVMAATFNTQKEKTVKLEGLSDWPLGKYVMEIKSKDRNGNEVEAVKFFTLFSAESHKVPLDLQDWYVPHKVEAEPGEKAVMFIGSADRNVHVLYEVEHRGKLIKKERLTINQEQKKIVIPIKENHRGNLSVNFNFIKHNRAYSHRQSISVPWSNKELDISFETFRDKLLPGEKEEWRIKIQGPKKDKVAAEMAATLYDASLDAFTHHGWGLNVFNSFYPRIHWNTGSSFESRSFHRQGDLNKSGPRVPARHYSKLNWFGFHWRDYIHYRGRGLRKMAARSAPMSSEPELSGPPPESLAEADMEEGVGYASSGEMKKDKASGNGDDEKSKSAEDKKEMALGEVKARSNLNETAFFYPHLKTDRDGSIIIAFTIPEALTRWKMLGLAHTKDLKTGTIEKELVTQKDLMVVPNAPRFFRENDKLILTSKITNLSPKELTGKAQLMLFDALTMEPVDSLFNNQKAVVEFKVKKDQSATASWSISVPDDVSAVTYRVVAKSGKFSDGEEAAVPVLKNSMLVTETMPLPVRSLQTKTFKFNKLLKSGKSTTLKNHKLTLEFTSNPAWYAVQALPYIMEYPYECFEQTFSRYYANSIARHIVKSNPKIKRVFNSWKNTKGSKALLSNLEKNQELKSLLLQETPWVLDAKDESERKKRIALLFDLNKMAKELDRAWRKLEQGQLPSGGWSWFAGMKENRYITQHIVTGLAHLRALNVLSASSDKKVMKAVTKAMEYLDNQIGKDYQRLLDNGADLKLNHLGYIQIHYLYARSYFQSLDLKKKNRKAFDYYFGQQQKYWLKFNRYMQGMIALNLNRYKKAKPAKKIMASIKEHALYSEEMGMYWKDSYGYYWYQAPIETHALMIEAFNEIVNDPKSIDDLKTWLIKSKQTQDWGTTKATADACYALLLQGDDWLKENKIAQITMGNIKVDPNKMENVKVEAGTGYFKTSWSGSDIKPQMGKVKVVNPNKVAAWGAVYWQYFEQLDKITTHKTPLQLKKQLFLEQSSKTGPVMVPVTDNRNLKVGNRIKVRIELRVDRDMEFVHMKDMRAAGFEPENVISKYKWQDGLGYYESTKDASTNFFMDYLPKGTYVFEYPLRISHQGDFSNGITTIQCMYAPEFSSHSEGIRVLVK